MNLPIEQTITYNKNIPSKQYQTNKKKLLWFVSGTNFNIIIMYQTHTWLFSWKGCFFKGKRKKKLI